MIRCFAIAFIVCMSSGCYKATYINFAPETGGTEIERSPDLSTAQSWRHFWVYGWAPGEMVIHADYQCGGSQHVELIETERSFLQGLVAAVAGYYINIYSPYTGRVICDDSVPDAPYSKRKRPERSPYRLNPD